MAVTTDSGSDSSRAAPGIHVRPAQPVDAAGIIAVMNPIISAGCYSVLDSKITLEDEREFITNFPERGVFNVALLDGTTIVALQFIEPYIDYHAFDHVGCIHTYVALTYRRRGISSRLFASTVASAVSKGYEKLFGFVRADNAAALIAYRRHGFSVIGTARQQAKVRGVYVDEVLIEKFL